MADTNRIALVELRPGDARAGLELSAEAHWNQNEADWRFFIGEGTVLGVRDSNHRLIATAALLPYTSGNAWISMVLVTTSQRRQGLATRLVDACLDAATRQKLTAWLDATPTGASVYGPLGFTPTLQLRRLRLENAVPKAAAIQQPRSSDLDAFIARDRLAMGFDRSALLTELCGRSGSRLVTNGDAVALVRDGRKIRHIGPLFADSSDAALAMVHAIAYSEPGPLLIDAVHTQEAFLKGLMDSGWAVERPFQRMRFGRATTQADGLPFAVAGPEYG